MDSSENEMTYSQAMDELESIAGQLENEITDPDQMLLLINRAEFLVKYCKSKLSKTEKSVQEILNRLSDSDPEPEQPNTSQPI
ncbi:MAG: exodeoxyribonuclease VII small subunit [Thermaurantimonas sp.]